MKLGKLCLLLFIMVVASCTTNKECENSLTVNGYDEAIATNSPLQNFVEKVEVIPLKGEADGVVLSNPEKIVLAGGVYYILDNNTLLCYGEDGNYMGHIGEQGNGHGEYINIASFIVRNDTIKLIDSYKNILLAYSSNGKFLYEQKAPDGVLTKVKDAVYENNETLFLANYIYNDHNDIYTRWNTRTDEMSIVTNAIVQTDGTMESVGAHSFCLYENNIRYIKPFSNTLFSTQGDALQFQTTKNILSEKELEEIHNYSIMTYADMADSFLGFSNVFETNNYVILTFFNLDYTVVDKKNRECHRYSYSVSEERNEIPLINVLSSTDNVLIGIVDMDDNSGLKDRLKDYTNGSMGYSFAIIKYHVK